MQAEDQPVELKKDEINPENGTAEPKKDKPKRKRTKKTDGDKEEKPQADKVTKYRVKGEANEETNNENKEKSGNKLVAEEGEPRPETAKDGEKKKRVRK